MARPLGHCDRHPSANAMTAWYNANIKGLFEDKGGVLELCAHDADYHWPELMAQGFELSIDNRAELVHDRLQGAL